MKTVIIYDQIYQQPISYYVVDRDVSHLHGVYGNSVNASEEQQNELCSIVFDEEWNTKPALEHFPTEEVVNGAKVIVCGFLP